MEEKIFNAIFHTVPLSNKWTREELFKQIQFEFIELREINFSDFNHALDLLMKAEILRERKLFIKLTKKGHHIHRLNYSSFTMKHLEFHEEHGTEYMIGIGGADGKTVGKVIVTFIEKNIEALAITFIFSLIVYLLSSWMGVGVFKTVFESGLNKVDRELDENMHKQLEKVVPKE